MSSGNTVKRLMRNVARLRARRQRFRDRIPLLFHWGKYRKSVERQVITDWPGGYVPVNDRDQLYLPAPLDTMGAHYLLNGLEGGEVIGNHCPAGGVAVDVGANYGEWALQMARAVGPAGTVIAFEPVVRLAEAVNKTLAVNGLKNAILIQKAASNNAGEVAFTHNRDHSGKSGIGVDDGGDQSESLTIAATTLDAVAEEQNLERLDFLKIDVEGHELEVLEGARDTLERFGPALVLEAGNEATETRTKIADLLCFCGYAPVGTIEAGVIIELTWDDYTSDSGPLSDGFANVLFLRG